MRAPGVSKLLTISVILSILALSVAINYFAGTTITINGKQVTEAWKYIAVYLGLILLSGVLVILIPSVFLLGVVIAVLFSIFCILFFPMLPVALLLLPGLVLAGFVYLVYRLVRKKKK